MSSAADENVLLEITDGDTAATTIQTAARGWLARKQHQKRIMRSLRSAWDALDAKEESELKSTHRAYETLKYSFLENNVPAAEDSAPAKQNALPAPRVNENQLITEKLLERTRLAELEYEQVLMLAQRCAQNEEEEYSYEADIFSGWNGNPTVPEAEPESSIFDDEPPWGDVKDTMDTSPDDVLPTNMPSLMRQQSVRAMIPKCNVKPLSFESVLDRQWITTMLDEFQREKILDPVSAVEICRRLFPMFQKLPNVAKFSIPNECRFTVVGDIHGQLDDLATIFKLNGFPSSRNQYLFNGDIVDRGTNSVECLLTILALKVWRPNAVHINRGNHEARDINGRDGFEKECIEKYGLYMFDIFSRLFATLPLASLIDESIFVVHGGLFWEDGVTIDMINEVNRFYQIPINNEADLDYQTLYSTEGPRVETDIATSDESRLVSLPLSYFMCLPDRILKEDERYLDVEEFSPSIDSLPNSGFTERLDAKLADAANLRSDRTLEFTASRKAHMNQEKKNFLNRPHRYLEAMLWSDPVDEIDGRQESARNAGLEFGEDVAIEFMETNNLKLILRSHECVDDGFESFFDDKLFTVFSASNYCGVNDNMGAFCILNANSALPNFVRYKAGPQMRHNFLLLQDDVVKKLCERIAMNRLRLVDYYTKISKGSSAVSRRQWSSGLCEVLGLKINFTQFQYVLGLPQLGVDGTLDGPIHFMDFLSQFTASSDALPLHVPALTEESEEVKSGSSGVTEISHLLFRNRIELMSVFRFFDANGDGLITRAQLRQGLVGLFRVYKTSHSDSYLDAIVNSVFKDDKQTTLDYNEFFSSFQVISPILITPPLERTASEDNARYKKQKKRQESVAEDEKMNDPLSNTFDSSLTFPPSAKMIRANTTPAFKTDWTDVESDPTL